MINSIETLTRFVAEASEIDLEKLYSLADDIFQENKQHEDFLHKYDFTEDFEYFSNEYESIEDFLDSEGGEISHKLPYILDDTYIYGIKHDFLISIKDQDFIVTKKCTECIDSDTLGFEITEWKRA